MFIYTEFEIESHTNIQTSHIHIISPTQNTQLCFHVSIISKHIVLMGAQTNHNFRFVNMVILVLYNLALVLIVRETLRAVSPLG